MNNQDKINEFESLIEDNEFEIEYLKEKISRLKDNNNRYRNLIENLENTWE